MPWKPSRNADRQRSAGTARRSLGAGKPFRMSGASMNRTAIVTCTLTALAALGAGLLATDAAKPASYANDFAKAALGKVSDDMLILNGGFTVKEEAGNRLLELPGTPLDTFGVLFGPEAQVTSDVRM